MKFGLSNKDRTGAWLAVRLFQIVSFVPALVFLVISGYRGVLAENGVFPTLFSSGMCSLPCWETMGLSVLYRVTRSEVLIHFLLLGVALIVGLVTAPLLHGSEKTGHDHIDNRQNNFRGHTIHSPIHLTILHLTR